MKRTHLALIGLTLACSVSYFLLYDSSTRGDHSAGNSQALQPAGTAADGELNDPQRALQTPKEAQAPSPSAPAIEPQRVAAQSNLDQAPDASDLIRITVVEKESGQAVAQAQVLWMSINSVTDEDLAAFQTEPSRLEKLFEQRGSQKETDSHGLLELARPDSMVMLIGRTESLWSIQPLVFDEAGHMLFELEHDASASARVTDLAGDPVSDVPVCLRMIEHGIATDLFSSKTDKAGVATVRHLNFIINESVDGPIYLAVPTPLGEPIETPLDPENLGEMVTLVIPEYGGLKVETRQRNGKRSTDEQILQVAWKSESSTTRSTSRREWQKYEIITGDGRAQVFPVSLGLMTKLSTKTLQGSESETVVAMGPTTQGEWVSIEIAAAEPLTLRGRLILPDGMESKRLRIDLQSLWRLQPGSGSNAQKSRELDHNKSFRCSEDGFFETDLPDFLRGQIVASAALSISANQEGSKKGESPAWLGAQIHLPQTPADRPIDLGEIQLTRPPLLVSGRVQTVEGTPLGGAMVELDIQGSYSRSMTAISSADGRFEFYSFGAILLKENSSGEVTVRTRYQDYLAASAKALPGTKDLVIEMVRPGEIAGSLEGDPLAMSGVSKVLLKLQEGDGYATGFNRPCNLDEGGAYVISKLAPGLYTLHAQLTITGELVPLQTNIEVLARSTTQLEPIDMRARFNLIEIKVRAFDDREGICLIRTSDSTGYTSPRIDTAFDSVMVVGTTHVSLDFSFEANGLKPKLLEGVQGSADVILEEGLAFEIYLDSKTSPLEHNEILLVSIAEDKGSYRTSVSLDSNGESSARATAYLPHFGTYTTKVHLIRFRHGKAALPPQIVEPSGKFQFTASIDEHALMISQEVLIKARDLINLSDSP